MLPAPILTEEEARCAGLKFTRCIRNLDRFEVYWVPLLGGEMGGIIARSCGATREFRLPPGARWIGVYARPFMASQFLEDLEAALVKAHVAGPGDDAGRSGCIFESAAA